MCAQRDNEVLQDVAYTASPCNYDVTDIDLQYLQAPGKRTSELNLYVFRFVEISLNCVLINLIGFFGIVGNSINIAVLRQHGFQESTNIILVSLSTSDLIFTFIAPVTRMKCIFSLYDEALSVSVHTFVTVVLFMPKFVCLATSFAYVVVIAMERLIAVYFPFHVSKIFNKTVTKFLVIAIPVTAIMFIFPTFLALTYDWMFDPGLNQSVAVMRYTVFYQRNQQLIDVYTWIGMNSLYCASSVSIVTLCCLAIGFKLSRAAIKRELMTKRATGYDVKVVKMLITVCLVYLFVAIPTITIYSHFIPSFILESSLYELVDNVCVVLYTFNASVNFLVYVTMSQKFANTYRRLLVCQKVFKDKYWAG